MRTVNGENLANGLTKREHLAAIFLASLLVNNGTEYRGEKRAVEWADRLLKELENE